MNNIINEIIKFEKECSDAVEKEKYRGKMKIENLLQQVEHKKKAEMDRIIFENREKYKNGIKINQEHINRDLQHIRNQLNKLKENSELCDKVREHIISIIFK